MPTELDELFVPRINFVLYYLLKVIEKEINELLKVRPYSGAIKALLRFYLTNLPLHVSSFFFWVEYLLVHALL